MNDFSAILPGARVRAGDSIIGTVERLEGAGTGSDRDHMVVRSEDGQWRYSIPLMAVGGVTQETFHTVVQVNLQGDDLRHYITESLAEGRDTAPAVQGGEWSPAADDDTLRIPLAAEELTAHKEPIVRGRVHIHKGVEAVQQNLTVPVYHEEATVERISIDQYDANAATNPNEVIIPVMEEQLVVERRQVVKEYIRIRKNVVTQDQNIVDTVRREYVEVTEQREEGAGTETPLLRAVDGSASAGATQMAQPSRGM